MDIIHSHINLLTSVPLCLKYRCVLDNEKWSNTWNVDKSKEEKKNRARTMNLKTAFLSIILLYLLYVYVMHRPKPFTHSCEIYQAEHRTYTVDWWQRFLVDDGCVWQFFVKKKLSQYSEQKRNRKLFETFVHASMWCNSHCVLN